MALHAGTRLGPYEILGQLGAGGMGEVYRARDARLHRDVAIKVLPPEFSQDAERVTRFEREARTLASLNHQNIAQVYGFEQSAEVSALAMEFVEGETIAHRIRRIGDALSGSEALEIARQIVAALDAAHERGVVHRDLKPANVMITAAGDVKVLDFGLAKSASPELDPSQSPTAHLLTATGAIIGTAAYMSPEQARGRATDKRGDIWAFGCVLYEMLTGRIAFDGDNTTDILVAVVQKEPDWNALPTGTPRSVRALLKSCLQKDPRQRLRDIADARMLLADEGGSEEVAVARVSGPRLPVLAWFALGAALAAALTFTLTRSQIANQPTPRQLELQSITDAIGVEESPALSPDGKSIAYTAPVNGQRQIWVRLLAGGAALQLTNDAVDHIQPRWTADSSAIIYFTPAKESGQNGSLWQIAALGGTARPLVAAATGGDVSHDGKRLAVFDIQQTVTVLSVISLDGRPPQRLRELSPGSAYVNPRWSPDDKSIAFVESDSIQFDRRVAVIPASGGDVRVIARGDDLRGLAWVSNSAIVYSSSSGSTVLYPPTFNLRVVESDGSNDHALTSGDESFIEPDADANGTIAVSRVRSQSNVWQIPVTGSPQENVRTARRITSQTGAAQVPSLSPDDSEVVYLSDSGGHGNLWIADTKTTDIRQLTFERDPTVSIGVPVWSPIGDAITFVMTRAGAGGQWLINRDGSGLRQFVTGLWAYWSPDGRWLYYTIDRQSRFVIEKVPAAGGAPIAVRSDDAVSPSVANDGTLFFCSPVRGSAWEWKVQKAPAESGPATTLTRIPGARVAVDPNNVHPILSPDNKWLVQALIDAATTNLWLINTVDGAMHPVTDFGDRPTVIARRVSWARDSKSIYAAVADIDADVVLLKNVPR